MIPPSTASTARRRRRWRSPNTSRSIAGLPTDRHRIIPSSRRFCRLLKAAFRSCIRCLPSRSMADVRMMLSGLKDLSPKPWPQRFREAQAAGGHVEIVQSRIQQGDSAGGSRRHARSQRSGPHRRRIADDGCRHREGDFPRSGSKKMLDEGVPQATLDRVAPGVKTQDINNLFGALDRAISRSRQGSSSRTPMSASPPESTRLAAKPCWKVRRRAPSRCALSTARSISARSGWRRSRRCFERGAR